jgi:hypothetical protein
MLTKIMNRYAPAVATWMIDGRWLVEFRIGLESVPTALEMLESRHAFDPEIAGEGVQPVCIDIGIDSGSIPAGSMGSDRGFDHPCLGDSPDLADRLELWFTPYHV